MFVAENDIVVLEKGKEIMIPESYNEFFNEEFEINIDAKGEDYSSFWPIISCIKQYENLEIETSEILQLIQPSQPKQTNRYLLKNFPDKLKKINIYAKSFVLSTFDSFQLEIICQNNLISYEYKNVYNNIYTDKNAIKLGEFYRYDKGFRFFQLLYMIKFNELLLD